MKYWYCIYTKTKCEDQVSHLLGNLPDVEVLNPKVRIKKRRKDAFITIIEELFPCYVFSKFDLDEYYHTIKYTRGTRRILGDESGNPYIVDEEIIRQIQSRIADGFVHFNPPNFNTGDPVVIEGGPFNGLTGIFQQELRASDRVLILLQAITCQASLVIERGCLAKA